MKVLFLKDVRPTARAGEIKEVKNGFARNYLIPQQLAVLATSHEIARAEGLRKEAETRRRQEAAEWREIVDGIKETPIKIIVRTGPSGRLYGSVTAVMIAAEIAAAAGREVDRRSIRIPAPIRTIGKYSIPVQFADGLDAPIDIVVEPDEGSIERMEQAKLVRAEDAAEEVEDPTFAEALEQDPERAAAAGVEAALNALSAEASGKST
jgi:large subunit ribosomal protein L9